MQKEQYLTPASSAEAELIEKRSRFLARVGPAATEAEALAHIEQARRQPPRLRLYPAAQQHRPLRGRRRTFRHLRGVRVR